MSQDQGQFNPAAVVAASSNSLRNIAGTAGAPVADAAEAIAVARGKAAAAASADVIATLVEVRNASDGLLSKYAAQLDAANKAAQAVQAQIDNVKRAQAYSMTGNAIPEMIIAGYGSYVGSNIPKEEREIPKDWQPAAVVSGQNSQ